ncbi:MAG: AmmeMemoRadiSam system radical SAM enzyme [Pyrodictiaceae archaeon]
MPLSGEEAYNKKLTVRPARLWERVTLSGRSLARCLVCERRCVLGESVEAYCRNRVMKEGRLYVTTYGLLSAVESRPIEIKPLFHYWPGSTALTFSGWGCNFRCPWCQNYHLSWSRPRPQLSIYMEPWELAEYARKLGDEGICASFNEPLIHFEYVVDAAIEARKRGLYATMVTNGYMTFKALKELIEAGIDGYSIDIKGCPETYRRFLAANPEYVYRNAKKLIDMGAHVEMVFLVIPGANDGEDCIEWVIGKHLDLLGPDIPLHVNRYYPANRYHEPPTSIEKLLSVYRKARKEGIEYVYIGNTPYEEYEYTRCPRCGKILVRRSGYTVVEYNLTSDGRCPRCGYKINMRGRPVLKVPRWTSIF